MNMENSFYLAKPHETFEDYIYQSATSTGDSMAFQSSISSEPTEQDYFSDERTTKKLRAFNLNNNINGDDDEVESPYDLMMDCYNERKEAQEGQLTGPPCMSDDDSQQTYEFSIFISNSTTPSQEEEIEEHQTKLQKKSKKIKREKAESNKNQSKQQSPKKGRKGFWTEEEDDQVKQLYATYGPQWAKLASKMKNRSRKQIRDRYLNALRPDINYAEWTQEEEILFASLVAKLGKKWVKIAALMPGRTESQVKNKYYKPYKTISKKTTNMTKSPSTTSCSSYDTNLKASPKIQGFVQIPRSQMKFVVSEESFVSYGEDYLPVDTDQFKDSFQNVNLDKMGLKKLQLV